MKPKIWLTRPKSHSTMTQLAFEAIGFKVLSVPVLEIRPVSGVNSVQAVRARILDFDRYDMAIFVSQNAVQYGCAWLDELWPQLPIGCQFFAIGTATRQALLNAGLPVVGEMAVNTAMNSESLLATLASESVQDRRVIVFRGEGGRTHLGDSLQARGAKVDYCELYTRVLPRDAQRDLVQALGEGESWLSAHSGESLQNLVSLLNSTKKIKPEAWLSWPLLVPGERVKELAVHYGFEKIIVAENATDIAMCAALKKQLAQ